MSKEKGVIHIGLIILLLIGIAVGVYLVQNKGFFKFNSKANTSEIIQALDLRDADNNPLQCDESVSPPVCYTSSLDIKLRVKNKGALTVNPTDNTAGTPPDESQAGEP